jgi:hypothetical protein
VYIPHFSQGETSEELITAFSDAALQKLLAAFPSELARVAILTVATHLPPACTPILSDNTVSRLLQLPETVQRGC